LEKNEFAVIVGSPGSGKTTLVNVIAGFTPLDSGRYALLGKNTAKLKAAGWAGLRARRIGVVLRRPTFLSDVDLVHNVALPLAYSRVPSDLRVKRALSTLRSVGLEDRASYRIADLTDDQLRRAALARALVIDPVLILADEPAVDLEPESRALVLGLLSQQRGSGRAVLVVTQDPTLAAYADTDYLLEQGGFYTEPVVDEIEEPPEPSVLNPTDGIDLQPSISEVERETGSILGDSADRQPDPGERQIPIDVSVDDILAQNFVQEEWWRP
jgi:putative ABC transport system ATP-binding protein